MDAFRFDNSYLTLPSAFFHVDAPTAFPSPQLVVKNDDLLAEIGVNLSDYSVEEQAALFCGNLIPDGTTPFSQAYAGHQFGHFTNLGDGRAHLLGEHLTPAGKRLDIQYKGSGRTMYSRRGDGLAAISPMLREYLISEALYALGIPTTRSLSVTTTGEQIQRERPLPGAVLTRVASSHIRVGTFEYAAATQNTENLSALLDYTIQRHYPDLQDHEDKPLALLEAVMQRQIALIVEWMRVGFIHGVMNTDNVLLSGESIDFGPCAFMDYYHADQVYSSIDRQGRYAYSNQPAIAQWNLARLAEALLPLRREDMQSFATEAEELILSYEALYRQAWLTMMRQKLGLLATEPDDEQLATDLLSLMQEHEADFTNTFRDLSRPVPPSGDWYDHEDFQSWYHRYEQRRLLHGQSLEASTATMQATNPSVIPRNHQVEHALQRAELGDLTPLHNLLSVLKTPYTQTNAAYQSPPERSAPAYQTFCGT